MPFASLSWPGKTLARPAYRTRSHSQFYRHYAIKGPQNQSTETILQTFDHVTEGTVANPPLFTYLRKVLALSSTNLALLFDSLI